MLNINAFFEFKQRTRQTYSFQLAQLINHSQHLNEYYILPEIIKDFSRRKLMTGVDDPVSISIDLFIVINQLIDSSWLQKESTNVFVMRIYWRMMIIENGIGILF